MRVKHTIAVKSIYYYYDAGGLSRKEIPLGSDFIEAVRRWSALEAEAEACHTTIATFRYAAEWYIREVLSSKAMLTQRDNLTELNNLYRFFDPPPAPLDDIKPINLR